MTSEQIAAELSKNPLLLLSVALQNNPEAVSANAQSLGLGGGAMDWEQLWTLFVQNASSLSANTVSAMINVPFNPDAPNATAQYGEVIAAQQYKAILESGNYLPGNTWSDLWPATALQIQSALVAMPTTTEDQAAPAAQASVPKPIVKKRCGCQEKKQMLLEIALVALVLLLLIWIARNW